MTGLGVVDPGEGADEGRHLLVLQHRREHRVGPEVAVIDAVQPGQRCIQCHRDAQQCGRGDGDRPGFVAAHLGHARADGGCELALRHPGNTPGKSHTVSHGPVKRPRTTASHGRHSLKPRTCKPAADVWITVDRLHYESRSRFASVDCVPEYFYEKVIASPLEPRRVTRDHFQVNFLRIYTFRCNRPARPSPFPPRRTARDRESRL